MTYHRVSTRLKPHVPLVEQERITLPEHRIVVCPFVRFRLAIVLSVILRFMDSDFPFGIAKLFLYRLG
jgi:hypothetical protein